MVVINTLYSQDLESFKLKEAVKVSGGIGAQTTFYNAQGMDPKRGPFFWQFNANLNFNIGGVISAPFSATISSQASKISKPQPFNNFGISPKYKWATVHLGYRSMKLSEFSLSGGQFYGVGIELAPKESFVRGKVLYGRFAQAVLYNPDGTLAAIPSYKRRGWGGSVSLGKPKNEVTFQLFKAKDEVNSLEIEDDNSSVKPGDNVVFGVSTKQKLNKQISVDGEVDLSAYTNDIRIDETVVEGASYLNNIFFYSTNSTTQLTKAIIGNLNFKTKIAKFKLGYRRVDPDYKTMGITFINNDYEDFTLKSGFSMLKKKLSWNLTGGLQRNNLNEDKVSKLLRTIGGVGLTYAPNEKWNISSNFSNFNSSTKQTLVVTIDTLQFVQTTKSAGVNVTRMVSKEKYKGALNSGFNFQNARVNGDNTSTFYNGNLSWQAQYAKTKFMYSAGVTFVQTIAEVSKTINIGPTLALGKTILKDKLQLSVVSSFMTTIINGSSNGMIGNLGLNGNVKVSKKQKLSFIVSDALRFNKLTGNTSEVTASIKYGYSF